MFQACPVKMAKIDAASRPSRLPAEQRNEARDRDRQKAQNRDRLQNVEQRYQDLFRIPVPSRRIPVAKREQRGEHQRDEHAQR